MEPLSVKRVTLTDAFWTRTQELVRREMIPYQWEALNDRLPDASPSFCMHNFRAAGLLGQRRREQGKQYTAPVYSYRGFDVWPEDPAHPAEDQFYGYVFQDTDLYKWIEAVAYSLAVHPDPELEKIADGAIDAVCGAQLENGYLDTYYILTGMDRAFTDLGSFHELYCLGHLLEAAVAYYEATGKDKLLGAARRFADLVDEIFGPEPEKCKGYPGHEIAEMALARLYEATGEEKYLRLSKFFLDQRGTEPNYFDQEEERNARRDGKPWRPSTDPMHNAYTQSHRPVREQDEAVGHAVRAGYLYSGMADAARLTGDRTLADACRRLWRSVTREKLYITGGVGGTVSGEAFSFPYDLPNDTAYSETCAAIALVFFARRMLQMEARSEYADVMELALYNTVLSGMALDGKSFFYVNPLEVLPEACHKDYRVRHVKPVRQKWFGCACCPPNLARMVGSVGAYAYTESADTLWFHLYMSGSLTKTVGDKELQVEVCTEMPWEGRTEVTVHAPEAVTATLAFRIPGWCGPDRASVTATGGKRRELRDGYLYLTGTWTGEERVTLDFPMEIRVMTADPRVREDTGKAAVTRGPVVYCAEEADNGPSLQLYRLDMARMDRASVEDADIQGTPLRVLTVPAKKLRADADALYTPYRAPKEEDAALRLIPYYAWANRGEGEMRVWFRV